MMPKWMRNRLLARLIADDPHAWWWIVRESTVFVVDNEEYRMVEMKLWPGGREVFLERDKQGIHRRRSMKEQWWRNVGL